MTTGIVYDETVPRECTVPPASTPHAPKVIKVEQPKENVEPKRADSQMEDDDSNDDRSISVEVSISLSILLTLSINAGH